MRGSTLLLLILSLLPVSAKAEQAGLLAPEIRGYWLRPVSEVLGPCEEGSAAWGWSYKQGEEHILYRVNRTGVRERPDWRLPVPIQHLWYTPRCDVVWIIGHERDHLFTINGDLDRGQRPAGLAPNVTSRREIYNLIPAENGKQAWLVFRDNPYFLLAERGTNDISIRPAPELPHEFEPGLGERALGGEKLWVTDRRTGELFLVSREDTKRYEGLPLIQWSTIGSTHLGQILWMIPRDDKGLYVVAADGSVLNGRVPLLAGEEVMSLGTRDEHKYAWVYTKSGKIFAFRADPTPHGIVIELLNDGEPVLGGGDNPLLVDRIIAVGDGSRAWALPPHRYEAYSLWKRLWHLEVLPSKHIQAKRIDEKLYEEKSIRTVQGDALRPDRAWVETHDRSLYEIGSDPDAQVKKVLDLSTTGLLVEDIFATDLPGRLWITGVPYGALMGPATDLTEATISFDGEELRILPGPSLLKVDLSRSVEVTVTLDWPMSQAGGNVPSGDVTVRLIEKGKERQLLREGRGELVQGKAIFRLQPAPRDDSGNLFDVELSYREPRGSVMAAFWRDVSFQLPWYSQMASQPYFRGMLILILPMILLLLSLRRSWAVRSWVPLLVPAVELVGARAVPDWIKVHPLELLVLILMLIIATLVIGFFSPTLFRELAVLQPFRLLVPVGLRFRAVRRQVFRNYLAELEEGLNRSRQSAFGESYVNVPVRVTGEAPKGLMGPSPRLGVDELVALLIAKEPKERVNLLIEAAGGRGKSALLNELLARCIVACRNDPLLPLPVVADLRSSSIEEAVSSGLGRNGLSDDIVQAQLQNGDLIVFLDGLSESQLEPGRLEAFLKGRGGECTRLCLATRPRTAFCLAINKADRWIGLEPERLDRESVLAFIDEYALADAKSRGEDPAVTQQLIRVRMARLLPVCQAGDGTFLPLLVRWCMLAERDIQSPGDLYHDIIEMLLKKRHKETENLWEKMEDLCFETYWMDRRRVFLARRPLEESTQTIEELLEAGILIQADERSSWRLPRVRHVRFFHDSVQSYLTARALHRKGNWKVLTQAAGDPDFCTASTDLFDGGAELFWMCLQVFEPSWRLRQILEKDLRDWAVQLDTALSIDDILSALSTKEAEGFQRKDASPGALLKAAIKQAAEFDNQDDGTFRLGRLYAKLAIKIWPKLAHIETGRRTEVA